MFSYFNFNSIKVSLNFYCLKLLNLFFCCLFIDLKMNRKLYRFGGELQCKKDINTARFVLEYIQKFRIIKNNHTVQLLWTKYNTKVKPSLLKLSTYTFTNFVSLYKWIPISNIFFSHTLNIPMGLVQNISNKTIVVSYLINCGRNPKNFSIRINEHIWFVTNLVVTIGAESKQEHWFNS